MSAVCTPCPTAPIPMRAPIAARWQRLGLRVLSWPSFWITRLRAQAAQRARWRALRNLSDSTLRDIGLFDEMPPRQPGVSAIDYERGRWS